MKIRYIYRTALLCAVVTIIHAVERLSFNRIRGQLLGYNNAESDYCHWPSLRWWYVQGNWSKRFNHGGWIYLRASWFKRHSPKPNRDYEH